jgi:hypothetical protein
VHPFAPLLAVAALASPGALSTAPHPQPTPGASAPAAGSAGTTASAASGTAASVSEAPVPVPNSDVPPPGRRLSANRVLAIARALPKMRAVRAKYPGSYGGAYLKGPLRWQVSFFSKKGAKEIGQVIVDDTSARVLEQWTGFQIAWSMARGYPGAFGRHVNALYIWLPLCLLFLLPFVDPRRPLSLLHLDLLVLLSWSISLAFFNHAHIYASVPLAYPPLVYLLGRMLWLLRRPRPGRDRAVRPLRLLVPTSWLAFGVVFLLGFRIGLNVTDANVIDVGYAGVIGADKVVHGKALYGHWPQDNEHGDTYGPVGYESYVPFAQAFGWSGRWDDLPAAHAAAVVFDLLALGLLFWLGLRIRGPTLGVALAYAWVAYPFTLFALESNSNDTLVAVLVLAALLVASSPPARGVFAALAGLTKFAPLALVPVLATYEPPAQPAKTSHMPSGSAHGSEEEEAAADAAEGDEDPETGGSRDDRVLDRRQRARTRARAMTSFFIAFAITAAAVSIPAIAHDSLRTIYERTIAYQADRGSPFSPWGLYGGLHGVQTAVQVAAVVLALALAALPRRPGVVGLAAACAAILIAVQLGVEHWFYLYIPWFFPLVMIALLGVRPERPRTLPPPPSQGDTFRDPLSPGRAQARPAEQGPDAASGPARLRLPSAAWWPSSG